MQRAAQIDVSWMKWIVYLAVALIIIVLIIQGAQTDFTGQLFSKMDMG